jgi:hypothetical protein
LVNLETNYSEEDIKNLIILKKDNFINANIVIKHIQV